MHVQDGWSCLHSACQEGHLEVAQYLCERGGKELLMLRNNVSHIPVQQLHVYDGAKASSGHQDRYCVTHCAFIHIYARSVCVERTVHMHS